MVDIFNGQCSCGQEVNLIIFLLKWEGIMRSEVAQLNFTDTTAPLEKPVTFNMIFSDFDKTGGGRET